MTASDLNTTRASEDVGFAANGASLESPAGVSVIICCYNSAARLGATLEHLASQRTGARLCWEVIVVDNNSSDETAQVARSAWPLAHPIPLRIVVEDRPGLSNARAKGLAEAKFEFVSFIDDDNWVAPDWVQTVADIFCTQPSVGICGGQNAAVCEREPPSWFLRFQECYAVGKIAPITGFVSAGRLWGAGLCIRRQVWKALRQAGYSSILLDRRGTILSSCGDTELCLAASLAGWRAWYDSRLQLRHCIPAARLSWTYARKLCFSFGVAEVALRLYELAGEPAPKSLLPRFRQTWPWHFQGALRNLIRSGWMCLSHLRVYEGDGEILLLERAWGAMLAVGGCASSFEKHRRAVKSIAAALPPRVIAQTASVGTTCVPGHIHVTPSGIVMTNLQSVSVNLDRAESTVAVPLLYVCDFLPKNTGGGAVLMDRLLAEYPEELLTLISGSQLFTRNYRKIAPRKSWTYISFPTFSRRGRLGIGRLCALLDWLAIPLVAMVTLREARKTKAKIILSVAHGQFFFAAALVSRLTGIRFVLWVHDDWVVQTIQSSFVLKYFASDLFRFALRSASHVYAISEPMADRLRSKYGVDSEIQLPASEAMAAPIESLVRENSAEGRPFRIAFAGTGTGASQTLQLLAEMIASGSISQQQQIEFHLYLPDMEREAWDSERILIHPWLSQRDLKEALANADLLFLPYNFSETDAYIAERSFPSKAADYMSCGTPILLMAPASSGIVKYAREYGFAEIVDRMDKEALLHAVRHLMSDAAYRERLVRNARKVFNKNHNIVKQRRTFYELVNRLSLPIDSSDPH
jgi:glycosyltransferase involved in cell wall biosynthesis